MKPAMFMAIIPLSSMGLVNVALADDSPPPSTTGEPTTVIDSSSKTQPPATVESPFSIGSIFSSHFGNDNFGATVGYKAWYNTWDLPLYISSGGQENIVNVGSGTEISHIPVASFRYKNFFVSGSYFPKTDYNFSKVKVIKVIDVNNVDNANSVIEELSVSAERSEWDITTGYYVSQNLAVTFGYKSIRRNYSITEISEGEQNNYGGIRVDTKGLTLGLTSSVSLGRGFGLYNSFAYGRLGPEWRGGYSFSIPYYLGEMGLVYSLRLKNPAINAASFYAGYRFQRIDFEETTFVGQTAKDRTDGFVFGVNFSF